MNILQYAPNRQQTNYEVLKSRILEIYKELLKIRETSENVETRALIAEAKNVMEEFVKAQPEIYICIEGGSVQGASANCEVDVIVYDVDKYKGGEPDEFEQTPEEYNTLIEALTLSKDIKPVY